MPEVKRKRGVMQNTSASRYTSITPYRLTELVNARRKSIQIKSQKMYDGPTILKATGNVRIVATVEDNEELYII